MFLSIAAPGCAAAPTVEDSTESPVAADCGSWASVGHPFMVTWCSSCHASGLADDERHGAPESVTLDTLGEVRAHSDAVSRRALGANADMPPRGGVPLAERDAVAAWLACGAPGEDAPRPEGQRDADLLAAFTLTGAVEAEGDARHLMVELGGEPWLTQRFIVDAEGRGALSGFTRYEDGEAVLTAEFTPPLAIYDEDAATLVAAPRVTWTTSAGADTAVEAWSTSREIESSPDPRFMDPAPSRVVAEHDGVSRFVWWFSATRMVVAQAQQEADGTWITVLNTAPAAQRDGSPGFPLDAGGSWASRGTSLAVAP